MDDPIIRKVKMDVLTCTDRFKEGQMEAKSTWSSFVRDGFVIISAVNLGWNNFEFQPLTQYLSSRTKFRGFKPGRRRWIFKVDKNP
jgi:hypothetical protein